MRSLAIALSLIAVGCAHLAPEPSLDTSTKVSATSLDVCRPGSAQPNDDGIASVRAELAKLDQAALHEPDLQYGRERDEFLRSRERCSSLVATLERERERASLTAPEPEPLPVKAKPAKAAKAKAKAKHKRAMRVAAASSFSRTR